jgi:nucleoside-diphosphate-sugar epimerase
MNVLVTGGTGYIAGWCITQLLDAGHEVVATVRSATKEPAVRDAVATQVASTDSLRFAVADLTADAGWDDAAAGCDVVLHVASPLSGGGDASEDVIGPAVDGTLRVLRAAMRASVERVVVTSSCAAATPSSAQRSGTVDETCWTDADEPDLAAYRRSKTLAERAAWDFVDQQRPPFTLTTFLPAAVFGPALSVSAMSSLQLISRLLDGAIPAIPRLGFEVVDVRDVAAAHVLAIDAPNAPGERFIVAGELLWFDDIAAILRAHLGAAAERVPTETLPDDVVRSLASSSAEVRSLLPLLGRDLRHSSRKATERLGWQPRPAADTIVDSGRCIVALTG